MMEGKLTKEQLIELVRQLMSGEGIEEKIDESLALLEKNVPDPEVSDLIYWPNLRGFDDNLSAEQIVDIALSYRPRPVILGPATRPTDS